MKRNASALRRPGTALAGATAPAAALAISLAACACQPVAQSASLASPDRSTGTSPSSPAASSSLRAADGHSRTAICKTSQLKISIPWSAAAGGTVGGRIAFTNLGSSSCHLSGWPLLVGITSQGKSSTAVDRLVTMFGPTGPRVRTVVIKPGALAEAVFTGHDVPVTGALRCPPSFRSLRVTPPGNSQSVTIQAWVPYYNHDLPSCSGIWVSEVVPYSSLYQH